MHSSEIFPPLLFSENKLTKKIREKNNKCNKLSDSFCIIKEVFFSNENIEIINKQIILEIYKDSDKNYKVSPQKTENLLIIMNYIFNEYAKNNNNNIRNQIRELNNIVVKEIVPKIIIEIKHHLNYIDEISHSRKLNPLPVNVNTTKSLPSVTTSF